MDHSSGSGIIYGQGEDRGYEQSADENVTLHWLPRSGWWIIHHFSPPSVTTFARTNAGLELAPRPLPLFDFDDLDRVVTSESARPVGIHLNRMAQREYSYLAPGMDQPVRIT